MEPEQIAQMTTLISNGGNLRTVVRELDLPPGKICRMLYGPSYPAYVEFRREYFRAKAEWYSNLAHSV